MGDPEDSLPRLVIVYGHRSFDALQLREAARGWCEIIWLIDRDDPSAAALVPLLRRSGPVVEALGLSASDAAAELAPFSPDGIATFYDTGMEHVAEIAAALGLPFNGSQAALALEDKFHQREALRAGGLETPFVVVLPAGAGAALSISEVAYPAVLKPRRASGSWHTYRVDSEGELRERLRELEAEPDEELIVEGYLSDGPAMPGGFEADYVSVESVATAGEVVHLAITGRFPVVPPLRETGFFMPSTLDAAASEAVMSEASGALRALGVRWGCAHTEVKLTAEGPRVIEVNGRIGGGVTEMLKLSTGVDMIVVAMRAALGLPLGLPSGLPPVGDAVVDDAIVDDATGAGSGVAYRFFYQPPSSARRLVSLTGIEELGRLPGVESVYLHHSPGTELDASHGTRAYLLAFVGRAADHAGVVAMYEAMFETITVVYESGLHETSTAPISRAGH